VIKVLIVGMAIAGVLYVSEFLPVSHRFAFGLGGMGFTWTVIGACVIGLIAYRSVK
jgi:hypothetical protein